MDTEFKRRWLENRAPFDGQMVTLSDLVPLSELPKALATVVDCLQLYRPEFQLFRLSDWHEHDGWTIEGRPVPWEELKDLVSTEAMLLACVGDSYVREAFFPEERDWYLRLYVPDHADNPRHSYDDPNLIEYGLFDITCAEPLAVRTAGALAAAGIPGVKVMTAKTYFDENAA